MLLTRAPGYVLAVTVEQIDARRFEQLLADARASGADERRGILLRALDVWRGLALAEFAFQEWAQTEARRLDELRSSPSRSGSQPTSSSDARPTSSRSSSRSSESIRCASGPASS